jgi:hypothetical protein
MENAQVRNNMQLRCAKKALIDTAAAGHTSHVPNPTMPVRRATRLLAMREHFVLIVLNFGISSVLDRRSWDYMFYRERFFASLSCGVRPAL